MKRKGKGKYLGAAIALVAGVTVLTASVFANYDNANGYSVVKEAVKNTVTQQILNYDAANVTADAVFEVLVDGQSVVKMTGNAKYSHDKEDVKESSKITVDSPLDIGVGLEQFNLQDGQRIYQNTHADGTTNNYLYKDSELHSSSSKTQEETDMEQKAVKFVETLADALVGDVKNYFVLAEDNGSDRTYTVNLSGSQLPEYVTTGISLMTAGVRESVDEDFASYEGLSSEKAALYKTLQSVLNSKVDPKIETANAKIRVNNDNLLSGAYGDVTFSGVDENGAAHELKLVMSAELYDYGATVADRVDVNSIPNLEVIDSKVINSAEVSSTRDADGNVMYTYTDENGNTITTDVADGELLNSNGTIKEGEQVIVNSGEPEAEDSNE